MKKYIALLMSIVPLTGIAVWPGDINRDRHQKFPTQRIITHEDTAQGIREKGSALAMYAAMTNTLTDAVANALERNETVESDLIEKITQHRTTISNILNELTRDLHSLGQQKAKPTSHLLQHPADRAFFMRWPRPPLPRSR